MRYV
jgi:hypothetical protein